VLKGNIGREGSEGERGRFQVKKTKK